MVAGLISTDFCSYTVSTGKSMAFSGFFCVSSAYVTIIVTMSVLRVSLWSAPFKSNDSRNKVYFPSGTRVVSMITLAKEASFAMVTKVISAPAC